MGRLRLPLLLFVVLLVSLAAGAGQQVKGEEVVIPSDSGTTGKRFITIDFDNVDIRLFIKYISELTGKNFVIDKAVQGNVTVLSPTKISDEEAYRVFESVLEVNGFTTVTSGAVIKILPSADARSQNVQTLRTGAASHPEYRVVTQLVPLKYSSPDEMKKVLTPLVSKTSVVISYPQAGMLILTETLSNIQRLLAIIEALDVEFTEEEVAVIDLQHAAADSIAKILASIYQRSPVKKGAVATTALKVVPYDRVNALVVLADIEELRRVRKLVAKLDTPVQRGGGNINVYYLQNATAAELAKVLTTMSTGQPAEAEGGKAPAISRDVKITADEETNSLIITATREEYAVLEDVIKKLDIPRQMVYLEALILEVNDSKDFNVGVDWMWNGRVSGHDTAAFGSFNSNSDIDVGSAGLSLGILRQGIKIGDITFPDIHAILRAYKGDSDINIVSTPQILTTDNKKAEISVGENVPYITSQQNTTGDSEFNYTNYEYRDVATKLTITPHINQADTMRLEIQTEIVKLKANSLELTPTTFRRTANTTVVVNDKDTVVIGGIIGEDTTFVENRVPLLGDIPGLGWLFKSENNKTVKNNMFIFITPKIMRNPADIAGVTLDKEDSIEKVMPEAKQIIHKPVNKENAAILTERGFAKLLENKNREAKEYFEEALEHDAENPYTLLNIGVVAEREGDFQRAADYYQKVIYTNTEATAIEASDPEKKGLPLVDIARENIERLKPRMNTKK